jgi:23S rRNA pseudoU1915 N3-methylase RlmH
MKIGLIVIGKTDAGYFVEAINEYKNRLTHYIPFEMEVIPASVLPITISPIFIYLHLQV